MTDTTFPPRFSVDPSSILKLLTGDTFYSSSDAAIREAVLNSIDAIARAHEEVGPFTPSIEVLFDRAACTVTIVDNGIGMTKEDITGFFSKVGASAARIHSADKAHRQKMIGEFGIGVMSYFLVGDEFTVHSMPTNGESTSLKFSRKMLDAETPAEILDPELKQRGTSLVLRIQDSSTFESLVQKFPYWIRNVRGLTARLVNESQSLPQGGLTREIEWVDVELPEWITDAMLGPPTNLDSWYTFDGRAHVDVLYSGVFVERLDVDRLWGIEGSIHVDPKRFRPKLNREGFVGNTLRTDLEPFLQRIHPQVLTVGAKSLGRALDAGAAKPWSTQKMATLWLALPRSGDYKSAADIWDTEFKQRKLIRQLMPDNKDRMVSVSDLVDMRVKQIYLAPIHLHNDPELLRHAARILREQGEIVIQGVERDGNYLSHANLAFASTESILVNRFVNELPPLIPIAQVSDDLLRRESLVDMMTEPVPIKLISLSSQGSPLLIAGNEIWINIDTEAGKGIVNHICDNPYGLQALIAACLMYAPTHIQTVANLFRGRDNNVFFVGPVRRQYMRRVLQ